MSGETWKTARYRGAELLYEVSNLGRVRRIAGKDCAGRSRPAKVISQQNVGGYRQVVLSSNRVRYTPLVHTLVALAFLGDPPGDYGRGKYTVNHKNGDKADNRSENLEWATMKENKVHASINGLVVRGENAPRGKLRSDQVLAIRSRRLTGEKSVSLAKEYGVSPNSIWAICTGKWWRHI